uniref:Uncharacterized protein n=1 Tax=Avena sativa TaxID=4498 RepID=A0ACD5TYK8_AVESA
MIFPPSFLDSSSWNDNQLDFQQHAHHQQQVAAVSCGGGGGAGDGSCNNHELHQPSIMKQGTLSEGGDGGSGGGQAMGPAKPMSMSERARLARVPLPEQGLKCPRCDSGNTKFCYFNNYSLTQPRHFCRACRRYWTRGGALRNVPVGGGYRRHAKRAKPKQAAAAGAPAASGAASGGSTTTTSSACTPAAPATTAPALPAMLSSGGGGNLSGLLPPLLRLADFDAMSLGSTFSGMGKPASMDVPSGFYPVGGAAAAAGLEQWRVQQMQGFPFFHAMADQQHTMAPAAAPAMAMPGMLHYLGLDSGGHGNGEDDDRADHQFRAMMAAKREAGYPRSGSIGMYGGGDHHLTTGYTSAYSNTTATGNHLL